MRRFLVAVICFGALMASEGTDYLTSEEDILEALGRNEISYTEYFELLELFRDKVDIMSGDAELLLVIPGVDRRWVEAVHEARGKAGVFADEKAFIRWFPFDFERIEAFVVFEKRERSDFSGSVKVYMHGKYAVDEKMTANMSVSAGSRKVRSEARFLYDGDVMKCRRRCVRADVLGGRLIVGSFDEDFGNGLVLGRAFHVPGAMRTNEGTVSLATPVDNLFNGAFYRGQFDRIRAGAMASRVLFDSIAVTAAASELGFSPSKDLTVGGVFAWGRVESKSGGETPFSQGSGSVFGNFRAGESKLDGEFGFTEDGGIGACFSAMKRKDGLRSLVTIWSYSDDFYPLHGWGAADYRTTKIEIEESDVEISSRGAGESGAKFKLTMPLWKQVMADFDQAGWRTPMINDWGLSMRSALSFRGDGGRRVRGEYSWEKRTLTTGVREARAGMITGNWPIARDVSIYGYFRFRRSITETAVIDGISSNAEISLANYFPWEFRFRVQRSKTNLASENVGYWAFRYRNYIRFGQFYWLAEARHAIYDSEDREPLTEFRITCSYYWR
ncbi:MAG TPA: hypothetical protein ENN07_08975 [candidate division Zixibacteria bacterium]|nr:hypothetical protein [candidate division Zixibacteria bacterium]